MIITKAPFRLSLFGGGTDYPHWFAEQPSTVVAAAINKYCYISVRKLPPFFPFKSRIVYSRMELVNDHRDIEHPSIRACLAHEGIDEGIEIHYDGDLPARSGIGSSSSFTSAMLLALNAHKSKMISKRSLALEAIKLEQEILRENVGVQDQIVSTYGGIQVMELGPGTQMQITPLILGTDYLRGLEDHLILGFTGVTRTSSEVALSHVRNIEKGKKVAELTATMALAKEAKRSLEEGRPYQEIGRLLNEGWNIKFRLMEDADSRQFDEIQRAATDHGAYGGKLMGAGGGGFMMFLVPPERQAYFKKQMSSVIKVWVPVRFDWDGAQVIFYTDPERQTEGLSSKIVSQDLGLNKEPFAT